MVFLPFPHDPPPLPFFLFGKQGLMSPKLSLNSLYTTDALKRLGAGLTDMYHQALLVQYWGIQPGGSYLLGTELSPPPLPGTMKDH